MSTADICSTFIAEQTQWAFPRRDRARVPNAASSRRRSPPGVGRIGASSPDAWRVLDNRRSCTRRSKNRPRDAAIAAWRGGVKVDHLPDSDFTDKQTLGSAERGSAHVGVVFSVGYRRHVHGGTVCAGQACGSCRGQEPACGGPWARVVAEDSQQDAGVLLAAGLPAAEASAAAKAGAVARRYRRHSGRRQAAAAQATAHGQADLRAAAGRARLHGRLHDREGLRAREEAKRPGDVHPAQPRSGRSAGRLRRSRGGHRRCRAQGAFHGLRPSALGRLLCMCLSSRDNRSISPTPATKTCRRGPRLEGHVRAFEYFGGVPTRILYDNTTLAVARILGDGKRQKTQAFFELQSH